MHCPVLEDMSFCTCVKSRDLLKVPEMSYCSRSRRRRFTALDLEPRFAYSLYNFYRATMTIEGRLLSSRPMLKPFSAEKILSPVKIGPKNGVFWENGGPNLRYWFRDPKRHFLARNVFCVKIGARV